MPWHAITSVTSGLTLVAFVAALSAWVYRRRIKQTERLIAAAPEADRARLIQHLFATISVDTSQLNPDQQYQLALTTLAQRSERLRTTERLILLLAVLLAVVALVSPRLSSPPGRPDPPSNLTTGQAATWNLLEQWMREHPLFIQQHGYPSSVTFADVHEQYFTRGLVVFNVTTHWVILFDL